MFATKPVRNVFGYSQLLHALVSAADFNRSCSHYEVYLLYRPSIDFYLATPCSTHLTLNHKLAIILAQAPIINKPLQPLEMIEISGVASIIDSTYIGLQGKERPKPIPKVLF